MKQIELEVKQEGAVWVSEPVQMLSTNAAIEYRLESAGSVKVQRSSVGGCSNSRTNRDRNERSINNFRR